MRFKLRIIPRNGFWGPEAGPRQRRNAATGETSRADKPNLTLGRIIDILANIGRRMMREREILRSMGKSPGDATIIIRADRSAQAGVVQKLIQVCQEERFEKFALRAKEEVNN